MDEFCNINCDHKYLTNNNFYCYKCGAISLNNSFAIKPLKHRIRIEIDPTEIFKNLRTQSEKMELSLPNLLEECPRGLINNYLKKRKKLLKKLKVFIDKNKFKDKSFHLSVYLLDLIVSRCGGEKLISTESLAVGCLVLSSIELIKF
jgi:hypothetical protein